MTNNSFKKNFFKTVKIKLNIENLINYSLKTVLVDSNLKITLVNLLET